MWNKLMNLFSDKKDVVTYSIPSLAWNMPKDEQLDALDVFTSTGLLLGYGVVGIDVSTNKIYLRRINEQYFDFVDYTPPWYQGDGVTLRTRDYSQTIGVCVFLPLPDEVTEGVVDDTVTATRQWIFDAKDLYWEHCSHGLVPFFTRG